MMLESRSRSRVWSLQTAPVASESAAMTSVLLQRRRGRGLLVSLRISMRQLGTALEVVPAVTAGVFALELVV